jgi:type VI secretion system protein VasG
LPDKAVSLIDTACAKVALSQTSEPYAIEYIRRKIEALNTEKEILIKENVSGFNVSEKLEKVIKAKESFEEQLKEQN